MFLVRLEVPIQILGKRPTCVQKKRKAEATHIKLDSGASCNVSLFDGVCAGFINGDCRITK